jgi:hypothetical protein
MTMKKTRSERDASVRKRGALKIADVEYRVLWNEGKQAWDVFRNGTVTDVSARKKIKSAIDSAIRDAKGELEASEATIIVTCLRGRKLETIWKGP